MTNSSNGPNTPNQASRTSTPYNVPNASLIAASAAFARPSPKPNPVTKSYSGSNGALSAAKSVNSGPSTRRSSVTSAGILSIDDQLSSKRVLTLDTNRSVASFASSLSASPTPRDTISPSPSFSFLAANSAVASRPRLPSPLRSVDNREVNGTRDRAVEIGTRIDAIRQRQELWGNGEEVDMGEETRPNGLSRTMTDDTSIAPTTSLVKLFEQQSGTNGVGREGTPPMRRTLSTAKGKPPPIVSPKPRRNIPIHSVSPEFERPSLQPSPKRVSTITTEPVKAKAAFENNARPTPIRAGTIQSKHTISGMAPTLPPPRRTTRNLENFKIPAKDSTNSPPQRNLIIPRNQQLPVPLSHSSVRSDLPLNPKRPSPTPYRDQYMKNISPHVTGDSLANAIVGANLAIKHRSPSSHVSKTPPPLPAPRRRKDHDHHGLFHRSRSLSPLKKGDAGRMLHTLRPETEEETGKLKKHRLRHPNKHNEATRLRWQDKVSEEDLKRYEGIWATNRGLFIQDPKGAQDVLGLVVREIWSRSGLPAQKLARIWELVTKEDGNAGGGIANPGSQGRLSREQFVVGMYFIDMVLRGRNLPQSVSGSVWDSVRGSGLQVAIKRK